MSRHNKVGKSMSSSPSLSSGNIRNGEESDDAPIPTPVAQQAQQYLEENIKEWMRPTTHGREIQPLPLVHSAEPHSVYQHGRIPSGGACGGSAIMTRQALQEHNNMLQQPPRPQVPPHAPHHQRVPLTSPSSGYSDSYFATSSPGEVDNNVMPSSASSKAFAVPHSLSFGGCSQHSLMQGTSYSTPCGNMSFGITQPSAAASFFARAAQRLNLSTKKKRRSQQSGEADRPPFRTNFCEVLKSHPPPIPPGLLRNTGRKDCGGIGKVKVMLRMFPSGEAGSSDSSYMTVDSRKKQVTLYDPTVCGSEQMGERLAGVAAPKMFAFDAIFSPDDDQAEICSSSLCDVISSVVGGSDGCLFVYGHSKLGKTSTMIGSSNSVQEIGVIPSAISWLFRTINEHKHKTGARFSVRVSAVEVSGKVEELRDLLADYAGGTEGSGSAPGVYLRDDPVFGTQLMNQSELRAPTAERAAFLLDAALAARTPETDEDARNAHFLFTLHVYQYRVEKCGRGGVAGGRSRLHLFDLGGCEKMTKSRDGAGGGCLSFSALGNVILALFNGQKHVPYKDSKVTQLFREAVGSVTCRAAMIAHVSTAPSRYPETLATLQLASRIHRLRRKKLKFPTTADAVTSSDDKGVCRPFIRMHAIGEDGVKSGSSDQEYTSSSEQSCDTVIFVGSGRGTPMPSSCIDRKPVPTMSPLAKENNTASGTPSSHPSTSQRSSSKSNHNQQQAAKGSSGVYSSNDKTIDTQPKSAFFNPEHSRTPGAAAMPSPKKKILSSSVHSSPKHQKIDNTLVNGSPCSSPQQKNSKYVTLDYSDSKKAKYNLDSKGSPVRSSKSSSIDPLQKVNTTLNSAPNSPQSTRKSKRNLKQDTSPSNVIQSSSPAKNLAKEPKRASDETWIDGPRFTKPKFDSRTLHQLQKEKWVDGPGLYGYMDVQKESMVRQWVEDHRKSSTGGKKQTTKEVWIDFPPGSGEKRLHRSSSSKGETSAPENIENKSRTLGHEDTPRRSRKHQSKVEVEVHHYAKPNVSGHNQSTQDLASRSKLDEIHEENFALEDSVKEKVLSNQDAEIVNEESVKEMLKYLENQLSDENSNSSVDFNDNDSDDLSHKLKCIPANDNSTFSRSSLYGEYDAMQADLHETYSDDSSEVVPMVDSCIQVTEEDIYSSCGLPDNYAVNNHLGVFNQARGIEHPLRMLSAEDLNLASSFSGSRAVSVDLDSISVPETWTGGTDDMDPDLTWKLLRGNSFSKYELRDTDKGRTNDNPSFKIEARSQTLSAKLERLSRLRELFEKRTDNREQWKPLQFPQRLNDIASRDNRFFFSNKLHHSADSSLEELRETDSNSIHSEPAELDVDKFDFQFNVKPMNGLRLEAFYNKICKVPRFPDSKTQFGKPTQIVPPIVKQPRNYVQLPLGDTMFSNDNIQESKERFQDDNSKSPSSLRKRWSASFRHPDGASDSELNRHPSISDITNLKPCDIQEHSETNNFSNCNYDATKTQNSTERIKRQSLVEIIHEQRCQVYSEGQTTNVHHPVKHSFNHRSSKSTKVITEQITNVVRNIEVTELKNDCSSHKRHQKKNGSPKLPVRCLTDASRSASSRQSRSKAIPSSISSSSPNTSPQHYAKTTDSSKDPDFGVSSSVSWSQSAAAQNCPYLMETHIDPSDPSVLRNHLLCRSTSTPTSPFLSDETQQPWANVDYSERTSAQSYVCCTSMSRPEAVTVLTPPSSYKKKGSKWGVRASSSGHGSDSSALSGDLKDTKELLGCMPKVQQFSGTSSGYESMPRDSEGTPLSSSSHESSSEIGDRREIRGRKGTRKKTQGSSKRSRSVPARPHVTNSPTWQPPSSTVALQPIRSRGRLVRELHDPSLWKSEEDVCCTSLLCCRLLDFY